MRILLIVQPDRTDFYNYLENVPDVEWVLLWYEEAGQMSISAEKLPICFKEIYFWNQFLTPSSLLEKIKPDRIIFFEIIDLRQIALIIAAKSKNIQTIYLEHGAAGDKDTAIARTQETTFKQHKLPYLLKRMKNNFVHIIQAKFFYYSLTKGFESASSYRKYLALPFRMLKASPNKVLSENIFSERVPDKSIVFNLKNWEEFSIYTGLKVTNALLTGVPFFDKYFRSVNSEEPYLVYIDHPYYEEGILGWTKEHHHQIAKALLAFASKKNQTLYIKLHPRSNKALWESYQLPTNIKVIQDGDFTNLYLSAKLIFGFSSSLINGFLCARKNVVLLGWHPEPQIFGSDFSKTGLCHVSYSPDDLESQFEFWINHNLAKENEGAYAEFLKEYNNPFDGKATERIISAILDHEVS